MLYGSFFFFRLSKHCALHTGPVSAVQVIIVRRLCARCTIRVRSLTVINEQIRCWYPTGVLQALTHHIHTPSLGHLHTISEGPIRTPHPGGLECGVRALYHPYVISLCNLHCLYKYFKKTVTTRDNGTIHFHDVP